MKNTILITLIVIILGLSGAGVWYIMRPSPQTSRMPEQTTVVSPEPTTASTSTSPAKTYVLAEVSSHSSETDCWLIINSKVYDVTAFIPQHPGGQEILKGCGKDATQMFSGNPEHAENNAAALLPQYYIGDLSQ